MLNYVCVDEERQYNAAVSPEGSGSFEERLQWVEVNPFSGPAYYTEWKNNKNKIFKYFWKCTCLKKESDEKKIKQWNYVLGSKA